MKKKMLKDDDQNVRPVQTIQFQKIQSFPTMKKKIPDSFS